MVRYEQPAAIAHSDYTPRGAIEQLKGSFPGQEASFQDHEYDMIKCVFFSGFTSFVPLLTSSQCLETTGWTQRRLATSPV